VTYNAADFKNHLVSLARDNKIRVAEFSYPDDPPQEGSEIDQVGERYQAQSIPDLNLAEIPQIRGPRTYAIALHEFGHLSRPNKDARRLLSGTLGQFKIGIYDEEAEAWQWAKDHALIWTEEMQHIAVVSLKTYVTNSVTDSNGNVLYPPENSKIWQWLDKAEMDAIVLPAVQRNREQRSQGGDFFAELRKVTNGALSISPEEIARAEQQLRSENSPDEAAAASLRLLALAKSQLPGMSRALSLSDDLAGKAFTAGVLIGMQLLVNAVFGSLEISRAPAPNAPASDLFTVPHSGTN